MEEDKKLLLRNYALRLLSIRPRSLTELKGRLLSYGLKKGISQILADQLLDELKSKNLINDEEFAKWWIEKRRSNKPKGSSFIIRELKEKGISREIIDRELDESENKSVDLDLAKKEIEKKKYLFEKYHGHTQKAKISNYLLRRGFHWNTIYRVIDSLREKS